MELNGIAFSYFDAYAVMSNFIRTPSSYGNPIIIFFLFIQYFDLLGK